MYILCTYYYHTNLQAYLKTCFTAAVISGPTPSPGIRVTVFRSAPSISKNITFKNILIKIKEL